MKILILKLCNSTAVKKKLPIWDFIATIFLHYSYNDTFLSKKAYDKTVIVHISGIKLYFSIDWKGEYVHHMQEKDAS